MFSKIINPIVDIYDGVTNKFIGRASFDLMWASEVALLKLANYGHRPGTLIVRNAELFEPAEDYVPPTPFRKYKRRGILRATFLDPMSREEVLIEIRYTYDTLVRDMAMDNRYHAGSLEFSNIVIEEMRKIA